MEKTIYDRPSLHSADHTTRAIGRISAVMDQHKAEEHPDLHSLAWDDFCCTEKECGYDARARYMELYPEVIPEVKDTKCGETFAGMLEEKGMVFCRCNKISGHQGKHKGVEKHWYNPEALPEN